MKSFPLPERKPLSADRTFLICHRHCFSYVICYYSIVCWANTRNIMKRGSIAIYLFNSVSIIYMWVGRCQCLYYYFVRSMNFVSYKNTEYKTRKKSFLLFRCSTVWSMNIWRLGKSFAYFDCYCCCYSNGYSVHLIFPNMKLLSWLDKSLFIEVKLRLKQMWQWK